jgi:hypothetical protein
MRAAIEIKMLYKLLRMIIRETLDNFYLNIYFAFYKYEIRLQIFLSLTLCFGVENLFSARNFFPKFVKINFRCTVALISLQQQIQQDVELTAQLSRNWIKYGRVISNFALRKSANLPQV